MSLIKKRTSGLLPTLRTTFPELFDVDNFFEMPMTRERWQPSVNIRENDDNFEIDVAAPGLEKEDFNISVENGMLKISCKKEEERSEDSEKYTSREFNYYSFSRSFTLPESVDENKIFARYENGILKVNLSKREEAVKEKAKEIKIS